MKPTNVRELFDYIGRNPWLRECHGIGEVFKAVVDTRRGCIWKGKTATHIALIESPMCENIEVRFDEAGFTVVSTITTEMQNEHRYEYTLDPKEVVCQQPTPTPASAPAAT